MGTIALSRRIVRFGAFEADLSRGLLTRQGLRVKIEVQPFQVLTLLLSRPGEVITREEIRQQLWPNGTYVDFDGSLNAALKKLRAALNDDPKKPRFIETVPKRGYRLIVPVTLASLPTAQESQAPAGPSSPAQQNPRSPLRRTIGRQGIWLRWRFAAFASLLLVVLPAILFLARPRRGVHSVPVQAAVHPRKGRSSVAVLGFRNISGQADDAWLATAFSEMLSTELAGGSTLRLVPGEDVANLRRTSPWPQADSLDQKTAARIGTALNGDFLVLGSYTAIGSSGGGEVRLDVRLQDAKNGEILAEDAETGSAKDLFEIVSRLGGKLRDRMGVPRLQESEEAGLLASSPLDPDTARFYALGLAKLREFDALAARDLLEAATEADPKFSLAHAMLARAWSALGYEQKRKEEAKKALDLSTDLPRAERLVVEGDYYESLGNHEKAASVYHALFQLRPDNLDYGLQLAKLQFECSRLDEALETIRQLRRLPLPASDDPDLDLGEADIMVYRDGRAAERLYSSAAVKAQAQGRKLVYAKAEQGLCHMNLKRLQAPPECEKAYEIYLAAGNRDEAASCLQLMAEMERLSGHDLEAIPLYERAERAFQSAGDRGKAGVALNNLSLVLEDEGQWSRAEQALRKALEHFQAVDNIIDITIARNNISDILVLRGRLGQAADMYRQVWELDDSSAGYTDKYAHTQHASLLLMQGEVQQARQEIEDQLKSQGAYRDDPWQLANALTVLGDIDKASGNLEGARDDYQRAVETLKTTSFPIAWPQVSLAELAIAEGHPSAAEPLLRQAIAEFEKEQSAGEEIGGYAALGRSLLAQGKAAEAKDAIARASKLADLREFPVLALPLQILQARAAALEAKPGAAGNSILVACVRKLHSVIQQSRALGLYNTECEARLALGEIEMRLNPASARAQLTALASEAHSHGMELLVRDVQRAMATSHTVVAANR